MQSPDNAEIGKNSINLVRDLNNEEKSISMKDCSGYDECMDSKDGDNSLKNSNILKESSIDFSKEKNEVGSYQVAEIKSEGLEGESDIGVLGDDGKCRKIESLKNSIEEILEKVTLVGEEGGLCQTDSEMKNVGIPIKEENNDDFYSETESETSSDSTSSSSSESSDDDDDDDDDDGKETKKVNTERLVGMEEGQIVDSENEEEEDDLFENNEEFEFDNDVDEDEDIVKGPIKSKNEIEVLPPVPPVEVTLQPSHQILPVGVISSVLGAKVIVEGSEKHNPLSEGSILWITESRLPLGFIDEIFGPVKTPFYIVRHNSESEVPSGIESGNKVGFVAEFVGHVLNDKSLYQKGYDASGENDEEISDELEFSDDEKEADYKRMLKMSKRGNTSQSQGPGNTKKKNRSRNKTWTKDQGQSQSQGQGQGQVQGQGQSSHPCQHQHHVSPSAQFPKEGNQLGQAPTGPQFSGGPAILPPSTPGYQMGPFFPGGPTAIPQQVQQAELLLNGLLGNWVGIQPNNTGFPNGFQMNGIPYMQQNHPQNLQMPMQGLQQQQFSQFPQPFDLSQLVGASTTPFRPGSFSGPPNGPWVGMLGQNFPVQGPLSLGVQAQSCQFPMPTVQGQSCNSNPQNNEEVTSKFSLGSSSDRGGRGWGRKMFHRGRGGGRFSGGRGRNQSK